MRKLIPAYEEIKCDGCGSECHMDTEVSAGKRIREAILIIHCDGRDYKRDLCDACLVRLDQLLTQNCWRGY